MNDKMKLYLAKQLQELEEKADILFLQIPAANYQAFSEVQKRIRYVKHAITESATCEHCIEVGLVDTPPEPKE